MTPLKAFVFAMPTLQDMTCAISGNVWRGLLAICLTAASACTTSRVENEKPDPFGSALSQPLRDVSLMQERPTAILAAAAADPYVLTDTACTALTSEIAELDRTLGPDFGAGRGDEGEPLATELAASAIGDVVGLPFRGVVRRVSGAARRDRDLAEAALAGMVRRGFLRGVARITECAVSPSGAPAPASMEGTKHG